MKKQLNAILNTEVDRKDFLKYVASAGLMVVGGGVLLQSIGGLNQPSGSPKKQQRSVGYGGSVYGGKKTS